MRRRNWLRPANRADVMAAAAILLALALLLSCSGCKYLHADPPPSTRSKGYVIPPCSVAPPNVPCSNYVPTVVSACEKRFGKALCSPPPPVHKP